MRALRPTSAVMLALLTALVFAAPVLAKPGGNAAAAAACRHGGFVDYTDIAGHPFRNCVAPASVMPRTAAPWSASRPRSVLGGLQRFGPGGVSRDAQRNRAGIHQLGDVQLRVAGAERHHHLQLGRQRQHDSSSTTSSARIINGANMSSLTATGNAGRAEPRRPTRSRCRRHRSDWPAGSPNTTKERGRFRGLFRVIGS